MGDGDGLSRFMIGALTLSQVTYTVDFGNLIAGPDRSPARKPPIQYGPVEKSATRFS